MAEIAADLRRSILVDLPTKVGEAVQGKTKAQVVAIVRDLVVRYVQVPE